MPAHQVLPLGLEDLAHSFATQWARARGQQDRINRARYIAAEIDGDNILENTWEWFAGENDYGPHAWVSKDFGATFTRITNGLTGEVTRTLTEDTKNADVLYLGTETGIFVTLDRGQNWRRIKANSSSLSRSEVSLRRSLRNGSVRIC